MQILGFVNYDFLIYSNCSFYIDLINSCFNMTCPENTKLVHYYSSSKESLPRKYSIKEVIDGGLYLQIYTCYEANSCGIRNFVVDFIPEKKMNFEQNFFSEISNSL